MIREHINERLSLLYLCLQFCADQKRIFTTGERICINQERAQLMHQKDYPNSIAKAVPKTIEEKIKEVVRLVGVYNYQPFNQDPFKDEPENE